MSAGGRGKGSRAGPQKDPQKGPQADSEEWQPRRDDHLVEPFFGGLGKGTSGAEDPAQARALSNDAPNAPKDSEEGARPRGGIARLLGRLLGRR